MRNEKVVDIRCIHVIWIHRCTNPTAKQANRWGKSSSRTYIGYRALQWNSGRFQLYEWSWWHRSSFFFISSPCCPSTAVNNNYRSVRFHDPTPRMNQKETSAKSTLPWKFLQVFSQTRGWIYELQWAAIRSPVEGAGPASTHTRGFREIKHTCTREMLACPEETPV